MNSLGPTQNIYSRSYFSTVARVTAQTNNILRTAQSLIIYCKGPSINYVTLKSGKIDSPLPPVTPPSRMPKKMDAPSPWRHVFGTFSHHPPLPQIENLNKESRNKVNFKRMFIMLRKQCTLLMRRTAKMLKKINILRDVTDFHENPQPLIFYRHSPSLNQCTPLPHPCVT